MQQNTAIVTCRSDEFPVRAENRRVESIVVGFNLSIDLFCCDVDEVDLSTDPGNARRDNNL